MKNRIYFLFLFFALFLTLALNSYAAFPKKGSWDSQTVAANQTVNVTITDDVSLKGPIIIESGATLNISRAETQDDGQTGLVRITIASDFKVPSGCKNCMFWVKEGGHAQYRWHQSGVFHRLEGIVQCLSAEAL